MTAAAGDAGPEDRSTRPAARRSALQMLYCWEVGRVAPEILADCYRAVDLEPLNEAGHTLAATLARGTVSALDHIDPLIAETVHNWRIERLSIIDRLILRLAVYELTAQPDTPPRVVINEALELARTFSTEDSVKFVNGVLDALWKRLEHEREG